VFVKDNLGLRDTAGCPSRESRETIIDCDRETQQRLLLYEGIYIIIRVIFMHGLLLIIDSLARVIVITNETHLLYFVYAYSSTFIRSFEARDLRNK